MDWDTRNSFHSFLFRIINGLPFPPNRVSIVSIIRVVYEHMIGTTRSYHLTKTFYPRQWIVWVIPFPHMFRHEYLRNELLPSVPVPGIATERIHDCQWNETSNSQWILFHRIRPFECGRFGRYHLYISEKIVAEPLQHTVTCPGFFFSFL